MSTEVDRADPAQLVLQIHPGCRLLVEVEPGEVHASLQIEQERVWSTVARLVPPVLERPGALSRGRYTDVAAVDNGVDLHAAFASDPLWQVVDRVQPGPGGLEVERTWRHAAGDDPCVALRFEVIYPGDKPDFWMVPGVLVDGNPVEGSGLHRDAPRGQGPQPGLLYPTGWGLAGAPWVFSEELPVPAGCWLQRGDVGLGLFAQPQRDLRDLLAAVSLQQRVERGSLAAVVYLPRRDMPLLYRDKNGFTPGRVEWLTIAGEWTYSRRFHVLAAQDAYPLRVYNRAAWQGLRHARHLPAFDRAEVEQLRTDYLLQRHLIERGEVCGIVQLIRADGSPAQNWLTDGFCGRNVEFAYVLYAQALRTGSARLRALAIKIISFFTSHQFPNGLFFSLYDLDANRWKGHWPGDHACLTRLMGEAAWNLLEAFQIVEEPDLRAHILIFCQRLADFMVAHQLSNGSFGKRWLPDGTLEEDTGTNFSYITWFLCRLYQVDPQPRYLAAAERSFERIRELVDAGAIYGDCLDAGSVDREAAIALLQALNALAEVTGNAEYLAYAQRAAEFALTWQYVYDVCFETDSTLGKAGFHSAGMTLVSVEHPTLDPYGAQLGYELLRLAALCGDAHYRERGRAAVQAAQQIIARRPGDHGLPFLGAQPEQLNTRDWCYGFIGLGKGAIRVLIAWPHVLNLGALTRIRRDFPSEHFDRDV